MCSPLSCLYIEVTSYTTTGGFDKRMIMEQWFVEPLGRMLDTKQSLLRCYDRSRICPLNKDMLLGKYSGTNI